MKNVVLISPFFLPSNLAGVHRVRVMSRGLAAHGWRPTILTVASPFYEEPSDPSLNYLRADDVEIEEVSAWPPALCRPLGFGDISLRAQWQLRQRLASLVAKNRPDVIFATVLPGYTSLVGSWAKRQFNIPFVLDYQDPWVRCDSRWSCNKAGLASRLAGFLEPGVIRNVDALTAVSAETLDSLRSRKLIPPRIPIETIPIGADVLDHEVATRYGASMIRREEGAYHIAYLGTVTHSMAPALATFLESAQQVRKAKAVKIVIHLIGTFEPDVTLLATRIGVADAIRLHPSRVSYLDALRTMQDADLLVLLGSAHSHYTPSKLFPYWLSGKAIIGLIHSSSTLVPLSRELGGVKLILFDAENPLTGVTSNLATTLEGLISGIEVVPPRNNDSFQRFSSNGIAEAYASLFDAISQKPRLDQVDAGRQ
jgi:glycosyltransferase involved in cell wall biosynthesis